MSESSGDDSWGLPPLDGVPDFGDGSFNHNPDFGLYDDGEDPAFKVTSPADGYSRGPPSDSEGPELCVRSGDTRSVFARGAWVTGFIDGVSIICRTHAVQRFQEEQAETQEAITPDKSFKAFDKALTALQGLYREHSAMWLQVGEEIAAARAKFNEGWNTDAGPGPLTVFPTITAALATTVGSDPEAVSTLWTAVEDSYPGTKLVYCA